MIAMHNLQSQLKNSGSDFHYWGRGEIKELAEVLAPDEVIHKCVNGHYVGGFAMLVATNRRLILVDRKPMYLTIEAIWYDKIGQVDYNHRLLNATICISTPNKDLTFTSWSHASMRDIMMHTQEKMVEAKAKTGPTTNQPTYEESPQPAIDQSISPNTPRADEQMTPRDFPTWAAQSTPSANVGRVDGRRLSFPVVLPDKLTLYAATRVPFSRRRRLRNVEDITY
jgi:hypothetical protein